MTDSSSGVFNGISYKQLAPSEPPSTKDANLAAKELPRTRTIHTLFELKLK
jgi:hypothetical protein